jgi:hypothetical protein
MARFRNEAKGARGLALRGGGFLLLDPGQEERLARAMVRRVPSGVVVEDDPGEGRPAPVTRRPETAGSELPEPSPLDASLPALRAYLARVRDVSHIDVLIAAETAGKTRKGALAALNARRDELLAC